MPRLETEFGGWQHEQFSVSGEMFRVAMMLGNKLAK